MKTQVAKTKRGLHDDCLRLRGYMEYQLRDARTGQVIKKGKRHNVVTFAGRSFALKQLISGQVNSTQPLAWLALGTATAATQSSHTALSAYFSIKSIGSTSLTTATDTNNITYAAAVSWSTNETHASSSNIGEFALYNSSATGSGTMFNRVTTGTAINFGSTNTLSVTITITN